MRELSTHECDQAGGGGIAVAANGTVTSTEGTTTLHDNGSVTISTKDGWQYHNEGNSSGNWYVTNADGLLVDCAILHWLKAPDKPSSN